MKPTQSSQIDSLTSGLNKLFTRFPIFFFGTEANTNVRKVWDSDLRNQLVELYKIYFTLFFDKFQNWAKLIRSPILEKYVFRIKMKEIKLA